MPPIPESERAPRVIARQGVSHPQRLIHAQRFDALFTQKTRYQTLNPLSFRDSLNDRIARPTASPDALRALPWRSESTMFGPQCSENP